MKYTQRNRLVRQASTGAPSTDRSLEQSFESLAISPTGGVLIAGWMNDYTSPVDFVRVIGKSWSLTFDGAMLARVRRPDVEISLQTYIKHNFGYLGFIATGETIDPRGAFKIEIGLKDGGLATVTAEAQFVEESDLRDATLSYVSAAQHFGNPQVQGIACIDAGLGSELVTFNRGITDRIVSSSYVERFGPRTRRHLGSIVVCLYGKSEYLFLQNALFSGKPGIEDYEFIYICNSPELADTILQEARIASMLYDIDQTVVILPGNAGFGGANNAAVRHAETNRVVIMNPDVFPYDRDWARKHTAVVAGRPAEQTRLFGAPLYYDNGSLMHGGMYFEVDKGPSIIGNRTVEWQLARVEHYGKGAPPETAQFLSPRPVPAVTGAFMSLDKAWFERLGGFTEDFVFGHYEDADLCLKSLQAGTVPWLHDLKLWHLEGKGSTRLPVHEGGSLINRWLFSGMWGSYISDNLCGPKPAHPAFHTESATIPAPPTIERARIAKGGKIAATPPQTTKRARTDAV